MLAPKISSTGRPHYVKFGDGSPQYLHHTKDVNLVFLITPNVLI